MRRAGAAEVIADAELEPDRLAGDVGALLTDDARLERMTAASREVARPDAAERIADEILRTVD
jgi:UDP-N-acetylglucosamine--N-acetylmuramyl-(pentapeptide) pyrophosphoryl-undecaprenol N-acetylglucosamine transferase